MELNAYEKFPEPREVEVLSIIPNKKELGRLFKKDAKAVADALEAQCEGGCRAGVWVQCEDGCGAGVGAEWVGAGQGKGGRRAVCRARVQEGARVGAGQCEGGCRQIGRAHV